MNTFKATILSPSPEPYATYHFWKTVYENNIDEKIADPGNIMNGEHYSVNIGWNVAFINHGFKDYQHYVFKHSIHYYDHMTGA